MKSVGIGKKYRSRSPRTFLFSVLKVILSIGTGVVKQWGIEMTSAFEAVRSY